MDLSMNNEVIKSVTEAVWAEMERQGVYVDREASLVDGHCDMASVVNVVLRAIGEPMIAACDEHGGGCEQSDFAAGMDCAADRIKQELQSMVGTA